MEIIKAHCNKCYRQTRHEVVKREKTSWEDEVDTNYWIYGEDIYEMIKCCGCDNVALRHSSGFSEARDEEGNFIYEITHYPPATFRREPSWLTELFWVLPIDNDFVGDFIREIYSALRNGSNRLAVMGIRALIEQVMIDKVGDQGSFEKNLTAFERKGLISPSQRDVLKPVIEAGHATMHRGFNPSQGEVVPLIDVTENIIESIYINERRLHQIEKRIPPRKRRPETNDGEK